MKTPPSEATSQYPLPSGVAAMATMGLLRLTPPVGAGEGGVAVVEDASVGGREPVARSRPRPSDGCRSTGGSGGHSWDDRGQYGDGAGHETLPRFLLKFSGGRRVFRLLPDRTLRL